MGLSPQLTLEAAILREGGFEGIPAGSSVSELGYSGFPATILPENKSLSS